MGRMRYLGGVAQGAVRIGDNPNLLDTETITIGNKVYEWDNNAAVTAGRVLVTKGATAAISATNLAAAINANKPLPAVSAYVDPVDTAVVRIEADARGAGGNLAFAETMSDADNTIFPSGGNLAGGENAGTQTFHRGEYTVTALDVLATNIMISTGLTTPRVKTVSLLDSAGVRKYITSQVTVSGTRLKVTNAGATNPAAGDIITWEAWE